ncbi:MAG: DUF4365 domain-containing protein [candidate division Zixibacteria bacterium]|nr:DUF4365 domain-containing protein [candidate division Zixibacteria bacterium]
MSIKGSIPSNFHEGTRSEYLAQYIFSAFGTSVPVPHPEDSGLDLHCTLGERIGKRLHVSNYYFVQVKSTKDNLLYEDSKAVEWLISHHYPFLLCFVSKKENLIEVYHTLGLAIHANFLKTLDCLKLSPDYQNDTLEITQNNGTPILGLGNPILRFDISSLSDPAWISERREILKSWIEFDQYNLHQKEIGFSVYKAPLPYKSNEKLPKYGFLMQHIDEPSHGMNEKYFDSLFRVLATQVHNAKEKDYRSRFEELFNLSTKVIQESKVHNGFGLEVLAAKLVTAAKHFKFTKRVELTDYEGNPWSPPSILEYFHGSFKT